MAVGDFSPEAYNETMAAQQQGMTGEQQHRLDMARAGQQYGGVGLGALLGSLPIGGLLGGGLGRVPSFLDPSKLHQQLGPPDVVDRDIVGRIVPSDLFRGEGFLEDVAVLPVSAVEPLRAEQPFVYGLAFLLLLWACMMLAKWFG